MIDLLSSDPVLDEVRVVLRGLTLNGREVGPVTAHCTPEGTVKYVSTPAVGSPFVDPGVFGAEEVRQLRKTCLVECARLRVSVARLGQRGP